MTTRIEVKVLGSAELLNRLSEDARSAHVCAGVFPAQTVNWVISSHLGESAMEDFLVRPGAPSVLVVESTNAAAMNTVKVLHGMMQATRKPNADGGRMIPVIAVCEDWRAVAELRRRAPAISDWTVGPINPDEIFHRAMFSIGKQILPKRQRDFGLVQIMHDSRTIISGTRSRLLTEFEFSLAEFFLSKAGTTVSITRLVDFFREAGRSPQRNNMRVAIFGLRAKLEEVTNSQVSVVSVYRQGYTLRHARNELSPR
jgi:DNA-binding response OmpR family regulator